MPFFPLIEFLVITIAAIFVIVNPLTTAFIFLSLLPHADDAERQRVAKRSVVIATSIFLIFAILGGVIFQLFGITIEAFRIAGGLILFGIAMGMIRQGAQESEQDDHDGIVDEVKERKKAGKKPKQDISVIPLAIPFISGPGSIATVMIVTTEAPTPWHIGLVFLAILITTGTCYYAMIYSKYIVRFLGESGKEIITKVFGLILAVIAVQFVINGASDAYRNLHAADQPEAIVTTPDDPATE